ncbi:MAG: phosphoadenosine phosphosulfate reductase [Marinobacter sp. T13-3]|nr:MAG: phosphoadenosine phosphosulfate reductase [Marinobacter sp. T13-3]
MSNQIALFDITDTPDPRDQYGSIDLLSYDTYLVFFSGGKDSVAAVLDLIEQGVPRDKIELHHHRVDGFEGSNLFDWPVTDAYVIAFAKALGLKLYFSWKESGIEGEMLRENERTKPAWFETPDGLVSSGGKSGKLGTRRKFPAVAADLRTRWCSAYSKVDIGSKVITGQTRFYGQRTLVVTGERAEESANRAKYLAFEPHRTDRRNGRHERLVDQYRSVHDWSEEDVWAIMERWSVRPHPAYELGFGRCSCQFCIFASKDQWATVRKIDPARFNRIAEYEREFAHTIRKDHSVEQLADMGTPYPAATEEAARIALSREYHLDIITDNWQLPAGAYGENAGPV